MGGSGTILQSGSSGKKMVTITPAGGKTDEDDNGTFTIKAKFKTGNATVTFSTGGSLSSSVNVPVTK